MFFAGISGLSLASSDYSLTGFQDISSNLLISNSRYKSSFRQPTNHVLTNNGPFSYSYACCASNMQDVGNLQEQFSKSPEKCLKSNSVSSDDTSLKLLMKHSKSSLEQSAFDNMHGAKLKLPNLAAEADKNFSKYLGLSIFASSSDSSSSEGNSSSSSKGGSDGKKQGGTKKQSGSDNNSFINCLSCGLPCSKLDTECK